MTKKRNDPITHVALIELYPYHTELLYSQILFLQKNNCLVTLICDKRNPANSNFYKQQTTLLTYNFSKLISFFRLWLFLLKSNNNFIVLNTAQGNRALKFSLFWFPKRIKEIGLLHNTKKLQTSIGQKIISRKIKSYFVLADYIKEHFPVIKGIKAESINCIYTPSLKKVEVENKAPDDIWITIPGSIEYKRRDYEFLIDLAKRPNLSNKITFILLGNSSKFQGPDFIAKLKENEIMNKFKWFEGYVPNKLFYTYMLKTNFLFPLIHPTTPSAKAYLKYKVSGTFFQSYTYSKPLICHRMFQNSDFNFPSIFYQDEDEIISLLNKNNISLKINVPDFETEQKKYFNFLINA